MVTFIDERKKMRIPQRMKPRENEEPKQKKTSFKGAGEGHSVLPLMEGQQNTDRMHRVRHVSHHFGHDKPPSCRHCK